MLSNFPPSDSRLVARASLCKYGWQSVRRATRRDDVHRYRLLAAHAPTIRVVLESLKIDISLRAAYFLALHTWTTLEHASSRMQWTIRCDDLCRALLCDAAVDGGLDCPPTSLREDECARVRAVIVILHVKSIDLDATWTRHG